MKLQSARDDSTNFGSFETPVKDCFAPPLSVTLFWDLFAEPNDSQANNISLITLFFCEKSLYLTLLQMSEGFSGQTPNIYLTQTKIFVYLPFCGGRLFGF